MAKKQDKDLSLKLRATGLRKNVARSLSSQQEVETATRRHTSPGRSRASAPQQPS